ncbi:MAG: hypothetical protein K2M03_03350, partial [Muribaculaceae bacterium]|nr:hypothetical protein [Muribaculaceae bacterium]
MKKIFTALFGAALLSATLSTADAATVYFEKPASWENVGVWQFGLTDGTPDAWATTTEVTIDEHLLCMVETNYPTIIFANKGGWGNGQTSNLAATDGYVYNEKAEHIATVVDGSYVAEGEVQPIDTTALYLVGEMNGWNHKEEYKFDHVEGSDIYTFTGSVPPGVPFKISNINWTNQFGGDMTINASQTYTLDHYDNCPNLKAGADLDNVTFTLNAADNTLTVSAEGEDVNYKWFAAWNLNGTWSFGHEMEKQEGEDVYKIALSIPANTAATNYFAIFYGQSNVDWNDGARLAPPADADVAVNETESFDMVYGYQNPKTWTIANGDWTVVVDPTTMKISFDYGDSTGEANILINDRTDTGHESKSYPMTALDDTDDDDYTWSGQIGAEDEVMFNIHGVNYGYDPSIGEISEDEATGNLVIVYPLTDEDPGYVRFDFDANVTYNVNISKKTVTLIQTDPAPATINITKANGNTGIHRMNPIKNADGTYVEGSYATIHTIKFEVGDRVDFRLGDKRYNPVFGEANMLADAVAVPFTLVEADDTSEAPLWQGSDDSTPVYVRINNDLTGMVQSDIPTAVKTIDAADEEAVYFNLQG